jgi:hypothetical protein
MTTSAAQNTMPIQRNGMSRSVRGVSPASGPPDFCKLSRTPAIVGPISPSNDQMAATAIMPAPMNRTWCDHNPVA